MAETGIITLAIEAAVEGGSISLVRDGTEIAGWSGREGVSRAEEILPALDELLRENSLDNGSIGRIAVSAGPGSFTGIRIGLSTAMGLAAGYGIPLVTANVLRAMAYQASAPGDVIAAVPMGRSAICVQTFRGAAELQASADRPKSISELEFQDYIQAYPDHILAVHRSLARFLGQRENKIDAGGRLSALIGFFCEVHPTFAEEPLFIAKSF